MGNQSEFFLAGCMLHELWHMFDPCQLSLSSVSGASCAGMSAEDCENRHPWAKQIACLRDPRAVGAKRGNTSSQSPHSPFCNGASQPGVQQDQIGEAFADLMASQLLPKYIKKNFPHLTQDQIRTGYSHVFPKIMCEPGQAHAHEHGDAHPSIDERANRIWGASPEIRAHMGCPLERSDGVTGCNVSSSSKNSHGSINQYPQL
jgi:hypothetical protein